MAIRRVIKEAWRHHLISAEAYQRATDVQSVNAQRLPTGRELASDELRGLIAACLEDQKEPQIGPAGRCNYQSDVLFWPAPL